MAFSLGELVAEVGIDVTAFEDGLDSLKATTVDAANAISQSLNFEPQMQRSEQSVEHLGETLHTIPERLLEWIPAIAEIESAFGRLTHSIDAVPETMHEAGEKMTLEINKFELAIVHASEAAKTEWGDAMKAVADATERESARVTRVMDRIAVSAEEHSRRIEDMGRRSEEIQTTFDRGLDRLGERAAQFEEDLSRRADRAREDVERKTGDIGTRLADQLTSATERAADQAETSQRRLSQTIGNLDTSHTESLQKFAQQTKDAADEAAAGVLKATETAQRTMLTLTQHHERTLAEVQRQGQRGDDEFQRNLLDRTQQNTREIAKLGVEHAKTLHAIGLESEKIADTYGDKLKTISAHAATAMTAMRESQTKEALDFSEKMEDLQAKTYAAVSPGSTAGATQSALATERIRLQASHALTQQAESSRETAIRKQASLEEAAAAKAQTNAINAIQERLRIEAAGNAQRQEELQHNLIRENQRAQAANAQRHEDTQAHLAREAEAYADGQERIQEKLRETTQEHQRQLDKRDAAIERGQDLEARHYERQRQELLENFDYETRLRAVQLQRQVTHAQEAAQRQRDNAELTYKRQEEDEKAHYRRETIAEQQHLDDLLRARNEHSEALRRQYEELDLRFERQQRELEVMRAQAEEALETKTESATRAYSARFSRNQLATEENVTKMNTALEASGAAFRVAVTTNTRQAADQYRTFVEEVIKRIPGDTAELNKISLKGITAGMDPQQLQEFLRVSAVLAALPSTRGGIDRVGEALLRVFQGMEGADRRLRALNIPLERFAGGIDGLEFDKRGRLKTSTAEVLGIMERRLGVDYEKVMEQFEGSTEQTTKLAKSHWEDFVQLLGQPSFLALEAGFNAFIQFVERNVTEIRKLASQFGDEVAKTTQVIVQALGGLVDPATIAQLASLKDTIGDVLHNLRDDLGEFWKTLFPTGATNNQSVFHGLNAQFDEMADSILPKAGKALKELRGNSGELKDAVDSLNGEGLEKTDAYLQALADNGGDAGKALEAAANDRVAKAEDKFHDLGIEIRGVVTAADVLLGQGKSKIEEAMAAPTTAAQQAGVAIRGVVSGLDGMFQGIRALLKDENTKLFFHEMAVSITSMATSLPQTARSMGELASNTASMAKGFGDFIGFVAQQPELSALAFGLISYRLAGGGLPGLVLAGGVATKVEDIGRVQGGVAGRRTRAEEQETARVAAGGTPREAGLGAIAPDITLLGATTDQAGVGDVLIARGFDAVVGAALVKAVLGGTFATARSLGRFIGLIPRAAATAAPAAVAAAEGAVPAAVAAEGLGAAGGVGLGARLLAPAAAAIEGAGIGGAIALGAKAVPILGAGALAGQVAGALGVRALDTPQFGGFVTDRMADFIRHQREGQTINPQTALGLLLAKQNQLVAHSDKTYNSEELYAELAAYASEIKAPLALVDVVFNQGLTSEYTEEEIRTMAAGPTFEPPTPPSLGDIVGGVISGIPDRVEQINQGERDLRDLIQNAIHGPERERAAKARAAWEEYRDTLNGDPNLDRVAARAALRVYGAVQLKLTPSVLAELLADFDARPPEHATPARLLEPTEPGPLPPPPPVPTTLAAPPPPELPAPPIPGSLIGTVPNIPFAQPGAPIATHPAAVRQLSDSLRTWVAAFREAHPNTSEQGLLIEALDEAKRLGLAPDIARRVVNESAPGPPTGPLGLPEINYNVPAGVPEDAPQRRALAAVGEHVGPAARHAAQAALPTLFQGEADEGDIRPFTGLQNTALGSHIDQVKKLLRDGLKDTRAQILTDFDKWVDEELGPGWQAGLIRAIVTTVPRIFIGVWDEFTKGLQHIFGGSIVEEWVDGLAEYFPRRLKAIWDDALAEFGRFIEEKKTRFDGLGTFIRDWLTNLKDTFPSTLQTIWDEAIAGVREFVENKRLAFVEALANLGRWFDETRSLFTDTIIPGFLAWMGQIKDGIVQGFLDAKDGALEQLGGLKDQAGAKLQEVVDFITGSGEDGWLGRLKTAFEGGFRSVVDTATAAMDALPDNVQAILHKIFGSGFVQEWVEGLHDYLPDAMGDVADAAADRFGELPDRLRDQTTQSEAEMRRAADNIRAYGDQAEAATTRVDRLPAVRPGTPRDVVVPGVPATTPTAAAPTTSRVETPAGAPAGAPYIRPPEHPVTGAPQAGTPGYGGYRPTTSASAGTGTTGTPDRFGAGLGQAPGGPAGYVLKENAANLNAQDRNVQAALAPHIASTVAAVTAIAGGARKYLEARDKAVAEAQTAHAQALDTRGRARGELEAAGAAIDARIASLTAPAAEGGVPHELSAADQKRLADALTAAQTKYGQVIAATDKTEADKYKSLATAATKSHDAFEKDAIGALNAYNKTPGGAGLLSRPLTTAAERLAAETGVDSRNTLGRTQLDLNTGQPGTVVPGGAGLGILSAVQGAIRAGASARQPTESSAAADYTGVGGGATPGGAASLDALAAARGTGADYTDILQRIADAVDAILDVAKNGIGKLVGEVEGVKDAVADNTDQTDKDEGHVEEEIHHLREEADADNHEIEDKLDEVKDAVEAAGDKAATATGAAAPGAPGSVGAAIADAAKAAAAAPAPGTPGGPAGATQLQALLANNAALLDKASQPSPELTAAKDALVAATHVTMAAPTGRDVTVDPRRTEQSSAAVAREAAAVVAGQLTLSDQGLQHQLQQISAQIVSETQARGGGENLPPELVARYNAVMTAHQQLVADTREGNRQDVVERMYQALGPGIFSALQGLGQDVFDAATKVFAGGPFALNQPSAQSQQAHEFEMTRLREREAGQFREQQTAQRGTFAPVGPGFYPLGGPSRVTAIPYREAGLGAGFATIGAGGELVEPGTAIQTYGTQYAYGFRTPIGRNPLIEQAAGRGAPNILPTIEMSNEAAVDLNRRTAAMQRAAGVPELIVRQAYESGGYDPTGRADTPREFGGRGTDLSTGAQYDWDVAHGRLPRPYQRGVPANLLRGYPFGAPGGLPVTAPGATPAVGLLPTPAAPQEPTLTGQDLVLEVIRRARADPLWAQSPEGLLWTARMRGQAAPAYDTGVRPAGPIAAPTPVPPTPIVAPAPPQPVPFVAPAPLLPEPPRPPPVGGYDQFVPRTPVEPPTPPFARTPDYATSQPPTPPGTVMVGGVIRPDTRASTAGAPLTPRPVYAPLTPEQRVGRAIGQPDRSTLPRPIDLPQLPAGVRPAANIADPNAPGIYTNVPVEAGGAAFWGYAGAGSARGFTAADVAQPRDEIEFLADFARRSTDSRWVNTPEGRAMAARANEIRARQEQRVRQANPTPPVPAGPARPVPAPVGLPREVQPSQILPVSAEQIRALVAANPNLHQLVASLPPDTPIGSSGLPMGYGQLGSHGELGAGLATAGQILTALGGPPEPDRVARLQAAQQQQPTRPGYPPMPYPEFPGGQAGWEANIDRARGLSVTQPNPPMTQNQFPPGYVPGQVPPGSTETGGALEEARRLGLPVIGPTPAPAAPTPVRPVAPVAPVLPQLRPAAPAGGVPRGNLDDYGREVRRDRPIDRQERGPGVGQLHYGQNALQSAYADQATLRGAPDYMTPLPPLEGREAGPYYGVFPNEEAFEAEVTRIAREGLTPEQATGYAAHTHAYGTMEPYATDQAQSFVGRGFSPERARGLAESLVSHARRDYEAEQGNIRGAERHPDQAGDIRGAMQQLISQGIMEPIPGYPAGLRAVGPGGPDQTIPLTAAQQREQYVASLAQVRIPPSARAAARAAMTPEQRKAEEAAQEKKDTDELKGYADARKERETHVGEEFIPKSKEGADALTQIVDLLKELVRITHIGFQPQIDRANKKAEEKFGQEQLAKDMAADDARRAAAGPQRQPGETTPSRTGQAIGDYMFPGATVPGTPDYRGTIAGAFTDQAQAGAQLGADLQDMRAAQPGVAGAEPLAPQVLPPPGPAPESGGPSVSSNVVSVNVGTQNNYNAGQDFMAEATNQMRSLLS